MEFISDPNAQKYLKSFKGKPHVDFQAMFPDTPPEGIDLLNRMLVFNPRKRISLEETIAHPYFDNFRDANLETRVETLPSFPWDTELDITLDRAKEILTEELNKYRVD